ncbi:MAG: hypothetical protein V4643_07945 [Bacteroidota bacterium]
MKPIASILILFFIVVSCRKDSDPIPGQNNQGIEYFPIDSVKQYLYAVDSIAYNDNNNSVDTFSFQLKTQFKESFIDNSGIQTWRIKRMAKYDTTGNFIEIQNYFYKRNGSYLITTENNVEILKAILPIKAAFVWNGNLFNSLGRINSKVDALDSDFILADTTFINTLQITETFNSDFILETNKQSIYQLNRGLVYVQNKNIETQYIDGKERRSGYDIRQKLIGIIE